MIILDQVTARFGSFTLQAVTLHVRPGQYCVLLGPPGSGKTSLIELISGLRALGGGQIALEGRSVNGVDPADRHVGYVPQDYALFPTLNVFGNIAFGLRVRRMAAGEVNRRVDQVAARLGISALLGRSCGGLSGGERQRVALARALVLEPKVLLLDEPVAALDELTRQQICLELRTLHDSLVMTTIHVSHNFEETRSVADVIGVLRDGRLVQWGTAEEVFRSPASAFVARFVRAGNVLRGMVERAADGGASRVDLAGQQFEMPQGLPAGPACLLLRPQDASLAAGSDEVPPGRAGLSGTVLAIQENGGLQATVRVKVGDHVISVAVLQPDDLPPAYRPGQPVTVVFDAARLRPLADDAPDR